MNFQMFQMDEQRDNQIVLEAALQTLVDMKREAAPLLAQIKDIESAIKNHVLETGETAEVEGASVSVRNGYTRVSWDSKALQGYAAAHPAIEKFMKVSEVGPSVIIKVEA